MRVLKLMLILSVMFMALPVRAGEAARPENAEPPKDQNPSQRAERPKREAVKLSPTIHPTPPRPDGSGKMRRVVPPHGQSPLQHVPALMEPPPGGEAPKNR